jgi:hypothetical protein
MKKRTDDEIQEIIDAETAKVDYEIINRVQNSNRGYTLNKVIDFAIKGKYELATKELQRHKLRAPECIYIAIRTYIPSVDCYRVMDFILQAYGL